MRIAVLTSSRADYGIYLPLLKKLKADDFFELKIIAFGTHLSRYHGYTVDRIEQDGFEVEEKLETLILGDSETAISNAIGNTITRFAPLWEKLKSQVDLVFALGDRYEMFAAVSAAVPFNTNIVHLHGGETTLGAIDEKFRHAITQMSLLHFTATEPYCERVCQMMNSEKGVYNVGALSLDNLLDLNLYSIKEFKDKYKIDLTKPTILNTLHPETTHPENNQYNAETMSKVFRELSKDYQIVITMPNADTYGSVIRKIFEALVEEKENIITVENFGTLGYFSCIKYSCFLLGNTSSGLIEAPSLGKYAINLGERQDGRARSANVIDTPIDFHQILRLVKEVSKLGDYTGKNVYKKSELRVSEEIIKVLKKYEI